MNSGGMRRGLTGKPLKRNAARESFWRRWVLVPAPATVPAFGQLSRAGRPYFDVAPVWRNGKRGGSGTRYPLREGFVSSSLTTGTSKVKDKIRLKPLKMIGESAFQENRFDSMG